MDKIFCKTCGSFSMIPSDIEVQADEEQDEALAGLESDREGQFFNCHVCGDNWLTLKETDASGAARVTFVHHMGIKPQLRRTGELVDGEGVAPREWVYFVGEKTVDEADWRETLHERRQYLKAACCN